MTFEEIYNEGYEAGLRGDGEDTNPYTYLEAEYWSDGYEDAIEDGEQYDT